MAVTTSRKPLDFYLTLNYPFQVVTGSDEGYFVYFPDLPGCMTQAETPEEIGPMAEEARELWIETEYEQGHEIPSPSNTDEFSGKFNLRLPKSLHQQLVWSAEREGVSLNTWALTLLGRGITSSAVEYKLDVILARLETMDERLRYRGEGIPSSRPTPATR